MRLSLATKKLFILFTLSVLLSVILGFIAVLPVQAACPEGSIILNIPIPGLEVKPPNKDCPNYTFGSASDSNLMGIYIKGIYKFFVGIAGIIAVFMIVIGGVQWLFSEGNASKITGAKETITGAIIGLLLAAGSYTILRTINPGLVNLSAFVPSVNISNEAFYNKDGSCKDAEEIPCGFKCVPKVSGKGEPVMGGCRWCNLSAATNQCGASRKGQLVPNVNKEKSDESNCWYAQCPQNTACTYTEERGGFLAKTTLQYFPQCSSSVPLTSKDGKKATFIFKGDKGFECGLLYTTAYNSGGGPPGFGTYVGTYCSNNQACVIDISAGYDLEEISYPNPPVVPFLTNKTDIGDYLTAKCIP